MLACNRFHGPGEPPDLVPDPAGETSATLWSFSPSGLSCAGLPWEGQDLLL